MIIYKKFFRSGQSRTTRKLCRGFLENLVRLSDSVKYFKTLHLQKLCQLRLRAETDCPPLPQQNDQN